MVEEGTAHDGSTTSVILLGTRGRLVIPAEQCARLNLRRGAPLLLRVAEGRAELIPLGLVPRDQLWFYADAVQARVASAEETFVAGSTEEVEQSRSFEQSLANAEPRAREHVARALKRLRTDVDSLALRLRPIEPHRRYFEARVGHRGALILRRVNDRFVVLEYIHHRARTRAALTVAAAAAAAASQQ
jgi:bifunctional DNA-binding transcriptional regulator/antitoxin component of YhaV-PrlF toxin-antitoxin module